MTIKKVKSGDPLNIPAEAYNAFVDAACDFRSRQMNATGELKSSSQNNQTILVKNDSGTNCQRFSVLGIDGPVLNPNDNLDGFVNNMALRGVIPRESLNSGRFVILIEPVRNGQIGRGIISGICCVRIDVNNENHRFADVKDNDTSSLVSSGDIGSATILWKETGMGLKWAVVRLDRIDTGVHMGMIAEALGDDSQFVGQFYNLSGEIIEENIDITCNVTDLSKVEVGREFAAVYRHDKWWCLAIYDVQYSSDYFSSEAVSSEDFSSTHYSSQEGVSSAFMSSGDYSSDEDFSSGLTSSGDYSSAHLSSDEPFSSGFLSSEDFSSDEDFSSGFLSSGDISSDNFWSSGFLSSGVISSEYPSSDHNFSSGFLSSGDYSSDEFWSSGFLSSCDYSSEYPSSNEGFSSGFLSSGDYSSDYPSSDEEVSSDYPSSQEPSSDWPSSEFPSSEYPSSEFPSSDFPSSHFPSSHELSSDLPSSDAYSSDRWSSDDPWWWWTK